MHAELVNDATGTSLFIVATDFFGFTNFISDNENE
jgi:hypothetical protein